MLVVLIFFLFDVRSALIVAVTIPLSLLFAFICLDWAHIPANLLSIGAIDFGILVDGAVVMVENIYRELAGAARRDSTSSSTVIRGAAADVDRPIVYAIAVIVAGFLPDLRADRSVGAAVPADGRHDDLRAGRLAALHAHGDSGALRVLPAQAVKEPNVPALRVDAARVRPPLHGCLRHPRPTVAVCLGVSSAPRCCSSRSSARSSCRTSTRARSGCARRCRTRSRSRNRRSSCRRCGAILRAFPQVTIVANEHGRPDDGTDPTGFFNDEFYVGLKPYGEMERGQIRTKAAADRGDQTKARRRFPASPSTTRSPPRTRWTKPRPASRARST